MAFTSDVKSFSSYSKGLHPVTKISINLGCAELKLCLPTEFLSKIESKSQKFGCSALSIDGLYSQVSIVRPTTDDAKHLEVIARIAVELFFNSTLVNLNQGDCVSVGMLSSNPDKWLLAGLQVEKVKLKDIKIANGHTYRKEVSFECSKNVFECIKLCQYIGLNGSGLTIRESHALDGHYYFSVHVGKKTRELTVFGKKDLAPGAEFNLTFPFAIQA